MKTRSDEGDQSLLLQRSVLALKELRTKLESIEQARSEPIAIVGIGVRYPLGVEAPEDLWELLENKTDGVREIPRSRWDAEAFLAANADASAPVNMRFGAFLDAPEQFDAYFFGISPREAARIDPQQRLLLEVAWQALEDAGLTVPRLSKSATGVFVGANASDYFQLQLQDPRRIDSYTVIGGSNCIIANRLSYTLDLRGPSLTIDSACSSSLVALHLACQSLRVRDCDLALAAGVNVVLSPSVFMAHARGLPLASDGRCKTFDDRANGYVRGEGCGVVVLKRLSDALAAEDRIWAVIRGSAVNQDGLSNGLTAPNGQSQRAVIEAALANAKLEPFQVSLIEAHGTGTELGDPIEVETLKQVYGARGPERPNCALGSLKTNIGHLEAGAGIAGVIKAALALWYGAIPASVHFNRLNAHLDLGETRMFIPTELVPWGLPRPERFAAVSSFGAGGTNAHAVLGCGPELARSATPRAGESCLLPISARSEASLARLVERYAELLSAPPESASFRDICARASVHRTHHGRRVSVVAASCEEALERLRATASAPRKRNKAADEQPGVVLVFSDRPDLAADVAAKLSAWSAELRLAIERCTAAGRARLARAPGLGDAPASTLFALQVALAELLQRLGVDVEAVIGCGLGEVAAAHVSGALALEDAAWIVGVRAQGRVRFEDLSGLAPRPLQVPMWCARTGRALDGSELGASYWASDPDAGGFEDAVRALSADGSRIFLELGAPSLLARVAQALGTERSDVLASVRSGADEVRTVLEALSELYSRGAHVELAGLFQAPLRHVDLPRYPFARERFWFHDELDGPLAPRLGVREAKGANAATNGELEAPKLGESFLELPIEERAPFVEALVHAEVARILNMPVERLDPHDGFFQLGMDSLMAAQLSGSLSRHAGRKLPTTVVIEQPTVAALARYLLNWLAPRDRDVRPDTVEVQEQDLLESSDLDGSSEAELMALLRSELEVIETEVRSS